MKHISDGLQVEKITTTQQKSHERIINESCAKLVDYVFIKFSLVCREYDTLYNDETRENAEKLIWAKAFQRENITKLGQIEKALTKLDTYPYPKPPQLGVFMSWLEQSPEDLGLPSPSEAYTIALRINQLHSDYAHPNPNVDLVIKSAIQPIGKTTFRNMTPESSVKAFNTYYAIACRQFAEGKLEVINKAISEKPEEHPSDKERANSARDEQMTKIWEILKK